MRAVAMLIEARARRWPAGWLLPALGIALAAGFAGTVWIEATVAATQSARAVLERLGPLDRVVRVNWPGDVTPTVQAQALAALHGARLGPVSQTLLLGPVRLDGVLVRPAAITPLSGWAAPAKRDPCRPAECPMRLVDGHLRRTTLTTFGVRIVVPGPTTLTSPAPLGYVPSPADGQPPVLLSGDVAGLDGLSGLGGIYRTRSWFSLLSTRGVASWQLPDLIRGLEQAQARLLVSSPQFSFSGPFTALAAARAQADTAPRRLLLVGGGALAAVLMFIVLTGGGLRPGLEEDRARLRLMGARWADGPLFAAAQAAVICLPAVVAGMGLALGVGALLAGAAGVPVWAALTHSLLTPRGGLFVVGGWAAATGLLTLCLLAPARTQIADGLALVAFAGLIAGLLGSRGDSSAIALLLAPLSCLAAGVLIVRVMRALLPVAERALRHGPVIVRLAVVGLARGPAAPAIAIAFLAVSTGLGGFALALRATLARSSRDQAAQQVPLDALVGPAADFARPLALAPLARWRAIAGGPVFPVRRTDATFQRGGASVGVPALGLSAAALPLLRGWRPGDLSAAPRALATKLAPTGPARTPGPLLPGRVRTLSLAIRSPQLDLSITAVLRDTAGNVVGVGLGTAGPRTGTVSGRVPPGAWELQAFELSEPTGLQVTNDHQNGESAAAATQRTVPVMLGPVVAADGRGRRLLAASLRGWRGTGAMSVPLGPPGNLRFRFSESGLTGVVRPPQPDDLRPLPVLADPATAAAAARGGGLALGVDGLPVSARVVGVLRRFPTVPAGSGFVVADQARLAAALDAQQPGEGRPDELWISTHDAGRLRATLDRGALARLGVRFRADIERSLSRAPTARAVLGTLIGAAALGAVLALIGLMVVIVGALRDRRIEQDLAGQGLGPRALARELRARVLLAGMLGVGGGVLVALALVHLAVRAVQSVGTVSAPNPPVIATTPLGAMAIWGAGILLCVAAMAWWATAAAWAARR